MCQLIPFLDFRSCRVQEWLLILSKIWPSVGILTVRLSPLTFDVPWTTCLSWTNRMLQLNSHNSTTLFVKSRISSAITTDRKLECHNEKSSGALWNQVSGTNCRQWLWKCGLREIFLWWNWHQVGFAFICVWGWQWLPIQSPRGGQLFVSYSLLAIVTSLRNNQPLCLWTHYLSL